MVGFVVVVVVLVFVFINIIISTIISVYDECILFICTFFFFFFAFTSALGTVRVHACIYIIICVLYIDK